MTGYNIKEKNPRWKDGRYALKTKKEYQKEWSKKNREKCRGYSKNNYKKNREKILKRQKEYREKNKDRVKKIEKKYRLNNKDKIKRKDKERHLKNREKILKREKEYRKTPKGKLVIKAGSHRRRANLKYKLGNITAKQIKKIFERDKVCVYNAPICLVDKKLQLDHIVPIFNDNGNSTFYNYVVACRSCNFSKGNKNVFIWCKEQGIEVPEIVEELLIKQIKYLNEQKRLI